MKECENQRALKHRVPEGAGAYQTGGRKLQDYIALLLAAFPRTSVNNRTLCETPYWNTTIRTHREASCVDTSCP